MHICMAYGTAQESIQPAASPGSPPIPANQLGGLCTPEEENIL